MLLDMSHAAARRLVVSGAPVFLPVNPVEFHGPHLSLHNDSLISAGLARDLHAALLRERPDWPFVTARDLEIGVDPAPGPGSRPIPFRAARRIVISACHALADLGAQAVVLTTFHGSPMHGLALQAGVDALRARGVAAIAPLHLLLREMLTIDGHDHAAAFSHVADADERERMMATLGEDFHAGFFETSLSLHYAPDSVHPGHADLPPCPRPAPDRTLAAASALAARVGAATLARELMVAARGVAWYALRPFPGYTGSPHRASPAAGAYFARQIVARFAPAVADVLLRGAAPPRPILPWLRRLTLDGRLGGPTVPLDAVRAELPHQTGVSSGDSEVASVALTK